MRAGPATNLPFEQWPEVLGSERLTGATLDRLTHRCSVIETDLESYRLRDARRRRRGTSKDSRGEVPAQEG
jgi:DNA replication protein DnaC